MALSKAEYNKTYWAANRDRLRAKNKQWRAANPEKIKAAKVMWDASNKEYIKEYDKARRAADPELSRAQSLEWSRANPEKKAAASADWAQRNKPKRVAYERNREASKLQRTPAWADMGWILHAYEVAADMTAKVGEPYHVDHEIPLQGKLVSGLHVYENLQVIPGVENIRKHNSFNPSTT